MTEMHKKQTSRIISEKEKIFKALSFAKVFPVLGTQIWIFWGGWGERYILTR